MKPAREATPPVAPAAPASPAPGSGNDAFRHLFQNMTEGVAHCRMTFDGDEPVDFVYLHVNESFERQTGLLDVAGRRVTEVIPGIRQASPHLFELYGRVARTGAPERFEMMVEPLGEWFSVSAYCPAPDEFVAVFDVVTARKRAEESLRRSERQLRGVLDNMQDVYVRADAEGRVTLVSPSVSRVFGFSSPEELVGRPVTDLYDRPEDRRRLLEALRDDGRVYDWIGRGRRKDGSSFWASMNVQVVRDEAGRPAGTEGVVRDVTARFEAEKAMRESEERFRYVFENASVGKSITTPSGEMRVNEAFAAMLGYSREELQSRSFEDVTHPDDREKSRRARDECVVGKVPSTRFVKRYIHRDGSVVWADVATSLRRDRDGRPLYFVTTASDVSERVRAEESVRRLNAELEERVRERTAALEEAVAEMETFSYSVAHDLRAPARAIHGFAALLERDEASRLDEPGRALLSKIEKASRQMGTLVDGLLRFIHAGRTPMAPSTVDMERALREALAEVLSAPEAESVDLRVGKLPPAEGDRRLLATAWGCLLSNAVKFSAGRSDPVVEAGAVEGPEGTAYFVRDNGVGFDMRHSGKLFGVFERLHHVDEFPGAGIGLALVRRIAERHGGRSWAEGEPGRGATFWFTLGKGPRPATEP